MELDDELIREAPSTDKLTTLVKKVSSQLSPFTHTCTERPENEPRDEMHKNYMLKVEELSRRKLTEDFEDVTSFYQYSNVKTVHIIGDNDAKYPDAESDERAHQEFAGFTTVPSGARRKCEPVAGLSLTKRKRVSTCTVNFLHVRGDPRTGCHKSANLTKSKTTVRSGSHVEKQWNNCSQKQNPRS